MNHKVIQNVTVDAENIRVSLDTLVSLNNNLRAMQSTIFAYMADSPSLATSLYAIEEAYTPEDRAHVAALTNGRCGQMDDYSLQNGPKPGEDKHYEVYGILLKSHFISVAARVFTHDALLDMVPESLAANAQENATILKEIGAPNMARILSPFVK